jgi:hypothetical protein
MLRLAPGPSTSFSSRDLAYARRPNNVSNGVPWRIQAEDPYLLRLADGSGESGFGYFDTVDLECHVRTSELRS